jgi:hypothetical protein|tara:strand:+ start:300 stop:482 length:183 start_codon:yes stop_codon:yes gene_type:complete
MQIKVKSATNGSSYIYDDIPDVDTPEKVKDHLWNDADTNFMFKSREELDDLNKWSVEIIK